MLDDLITGNNPVEELKQWLKAKQLSGNEFSKICGVPPARISEILNGRGRPAPKVVLKIEEKTKIEAIRLIAHYEIAKAAEQLKKERQGDDQLLAG